MKKQFIAAGLAGILALSLAGCSGNSSNGSSSSGAASPQYSQDQIDQAMQTPTTLTFWTWVSNVQAEVDLFQAKYPAIKVNVVNPGQGTPLYTKLEAAIQAGTGVPDVSQIEYQYIPTFRLTNSLLDIKPILGDITGLYPAWVGNQVAGNGGIWAVPQDTGPMGMLYRTDLLQQAGISVPTTYDEFATAATSFHQANPSSYLVNMPADEAGLWLGMFWQAGAQPFTFDGNQTVGINLTSDAVKKVIDYWQPLIASGAVSTDADWTDQWYAALNNGTYATMLTAAWAPMFLTSAAPDTSGKWQAAPLPQWDTSNPASGNWGGSTDAVLAATKNPIAAAEFAAFINQDTDAANIQANQQSLFPSLNSVLNDSSWQNQTPDFYGGQKVNQVFGQISQTVNTNFQWPPFYDYVVSSFNDTLGKAMTNKGDLEAGLTAWQNAVVTYAQQQGFTVTTQ